MADLPDIDTTQVSYLTYWNAIDDGGVGSIDPEEVVSAPGVEEYTLYDNGVEGVYNMDVDVEYFGTIDDLPTSTFRVKSDGWVVFYLDRTVTYNQRVEVASGSPNGHTYTNQVEGYWDVFLNAFTRGYQNPPPDVVENAHARGINALRQEFSNGGSMTWNPSDTGIYQYMYPDATTMTLFQTSYNDVDSGSDTRFAYTSGTTIEQVDAFGALGSYSGGSVDFEGVICADSNGSTESFSLDVTGQSLIPDAETEYGNAVSWDSNEGAHCTLALWS